MSLTMLLIPAALVLAIWGGVMAVSGFRQGNKLKIFSGAGAWSAASRRIPSARRSGRLRRPAPPGKTGGRFRALWSCNRCPGAFRSAPNNFSRFCHQGQGAAIE